MRTVFAKSGSAVRMIAAIAFLMMVFPSSGAMAQMTSPGTPPSAAQPDTANAPRELSTEEVQQQIQQKLKSEPALTKFNIQTKASESSITLTGMVDRDEDRALAARIAESFAGKRKIVDHITLRETGSPQP